MADGGARNARSAHEERLLATAARLLPSGVRNPVGTPDAAMVVASARGGRLRDTSGNEYVDYLLGSGPMLLGHAHPAVVDAVSRALERGSSYLLVNEPAIELAERLVELVPCAEAVSFHNSGSEAVFYALRLARAWRGRDKILKFEGAYHGMGDAALMSTQWTRPTDGPPRAVPDSAGIPASAADDVLVAPFNDLDAVAAILERHHDELAAVLVEPLQRTLAPQPGFLDGLAGLARRYDLVLVFDEVVTGFRLGLGGAQQRYGVTPDLCALGKSLSCGHPFAALCGRSELMALGRPGRDDGRGVLLTGTYSANPISATAALAALRELERPGVYERLEERGGRLRDGLERAMTAAGVDVRVSGEASVFEAWFTDGDLVDFRSTLAADRARAMRFAELLLERFVVKAHEKFFVSTAHDDDDIERTLAAFDAAARVLAAEGC